MIIRDEELWENLNISSGDFAKFMETPIGKWIFYSTISNPEKDPENTTVCGHTHVSYIEDDGFYIDGAFYIDRRKHSNADDIDAIRVITSLEQSDEDEGPAYLWIDTSKPAGKSIEAKRLFTYEEMREKQWKIRNQAEENTPDDKEIVLDEAEISRISAAVNGLTRSRFFRDFYKTYCQIADSARTEGSPELLAIDFEDRFPKGLKRLAGANGNGNSLNHVIGKLGQIITQEYITEGGLPIYDKHDSEDTKEWTPVAAEKFAGLPDPFFNLFYDAYAKAAETAKNTVSPELEQEEYSKQLKEEFSKQLAQELGTDENPESYSANILGEEIIRRFLTPEDLPRYNENDSKNPGDWEIKTVHQVYGVPNPPERKFLDRAKEWAENLVRIS